MAKAKMGAIILYCGHRGTFIADIHEVGNVNVVYANLPEGELGITPGSLIRDGDLGPDHATHHLSDMPTAGCWKPVRGVFVVPKGQVKELNDAEHSG